MAIPQSTALPRLKTAEQLEDISLGELAVIVAGIAGIIIGAILAWPAFIK